LKVQTPQEFSGVWAVKQLNVLLHCVPELHVKSGHPAVVVVVVELVVVELVVLVVVVVEAGTHWLPAHTEPGSQVPHSIGTPQPLSIDPHCALRPGQSDGAQQTPNLSFGFTRTQSWLWQLFET
jgi:hypothetical protein